MEIIERGDKMIEFALFSEKEWESIQRHYNLTPRERQIAQEICNGCRGTQIAEILRIKPGTVKAHTRNIYMKTRARSKILMLLEFKAYLANIKGHM